MTNLEVPEGYELVNVPLHGVAFRPETMIRKSFDDGRVIEFYEAEEDQFVKAYSDGAVTWAPVSHFSIHRNIRVVIVNLDNGGQIVTDHDPRAVFGVLPPETEPRRFYPDEAFELGVLVPCQVPSGLDSWTTSYRKSFESLWDALSDKARLLAQRRLGSRLSWDGSLWVVENLDMHDSLQPNLRWVRITEVVYTDQPETGYDLTVPGYETFMSADGVILSNTMSVHVPSSADAVKDVQERLMASNMLWSNKDRTKTLANPKHEQLIGLSYGIAPGGQKRRFKTDQEAMEAIEAGQVDMNDDVEIGEKSFPQPIK